MIIYQDESGDLGWTFDKPYRSGGSSRFLTIAFLLLPQNKQKLLSRLVRNIYAKYRLNLKIEKKGSSFTDAHAAYVAGRIVHLVKRNEDIRLCSITIKKENVLEHMRAEENIIYNYALVKKIAPVIRRLDAVKIIPDKRTIKVRSGDSCADYLKTKLWFEMEAITQVDYTPEESRNNLYLWSADWLANFIWRHYEDGRPLAYRKLAGVLEEECLFFS